MPQEDGPYSSFYQAFHNKHPWALSQAVEAQRDIRPASPATHTIRSCGKFPPPALVIPPSKEDAITILAPAPKPQPMKQTPAVKQSTSKPINKKPTARLATPKPMGFAAAVPAHKKQSDQKAPNKSAKPIINHNVGLFTPPKKKFHHQVGQPEKPGKKI
jgi:hypothetical protein